MDRTEVAIVIAGGRSLHRHDLPSRDLRPHGLVIGINDACLRTQAHIGITMDRLWYENRLAEFPPATPIYYREGSVKFVQPHALSIPFRGNNRMSGLTDEPGELNGNQSGTCAINLAYKHRPRRLYLLGFDLTRGAEKQVYWYGNYPWRPEGATTEGKYKQWVREYEAVAEALRAAGIAVFNVSPSSALPYFPKMSFDQFIEETRP